MNSVIFDGRLIQPSKIVCIGRNYAAHIEELGNEMPERPVVFLKPNSAIGRELHADEDSGIHYEAEISFVVIGGELRGMGFGLDLTRRALQSELKAKGLPWERAKAFDGSALFSEFVAFDGDTMGLRVELLINDRLSQSGDCALMLNQPEALLREVKGFMTLEDGDLLMTGTPAGVGAVRAGDRFCGRIYEQENLLVEANWQAV